MHPEENIKRLGLTLPEPSRPVAAYIPARRVGSLLYVSGQLPLVNGKLMAQGSVPSQVNLQTAHDCARQCALNALAIIKAHAGDLSRVLGVVRVGVFVCSDAGFHDQPKIANGASELLVEVFGESGRHARAAVGSIALPLGAPVEVEVLVELAG